MGPFPHDAPRALISGGNDGFEFVESSHDAPDELRSLVAKTGYQNTTKHKTKAVELWQQGDITYLVNSEPGGQARRFVEEHRPCAPFMGWRVVNAQHPYDHAVSKGATPYDTGDKALFESIEADQIDRRVLQSRRRRVS